MTEKPVALIVLAAGQGSRMQSDLPKVLHRLGGVPLVGHALAAGRSLDPEEVIVVAGHGADLVEKALARYSQKRQSVWFERSPQTVSSVVRPPKK